MYATSFKSVLWFAFATEQDINGTLNDLTCAITYNIWPVACGSLGAAEAIK